WSWRNEGTCPWRAAQPLGPRSVTFAARSDLLASDARPGAAGLGVRRSGVADTPAAYLAADRLFDRQRVHLGRSTPSRRGPKELAVKVRRVELDGWCRPLHYYPHLRPGGTFR